MCGLQCLTMDCCGMGRAIGESGVGEQGREGDEGGRLRQLRTLSEAVLLQ